MLLSSTTRLQQLFIRERFGKRFKSSASVFRSFCRARSRTRLGLTILGAIPGHRPYRTPRHTPSIASDMAALVGPSSFHLGEQFLQHKTGVREDRESVGRRVIRDYMPEQHRLFFENQSLFYLGSLDESGRPWATVVTGRPGFVSTPDDRHVSIDLSSLHAEERAKFELGDYVGCLGIELHTRRRNRVNGHIITKTDNGVVFKVDQSFGNCPKYIQARSLEVDYGAVGKTGRDVVQGKGELGDEQLKIVENADTFFIASCFDGVDDCVRDSARGCDVSHRGGPPGFIKTLNASTFIWPDYVGNFLFNTLGNVTKNPRAGLLFIDYSTGDTLQLAGTAHVLHEEKRLPGAERSVKFKVSEFVHIKNAIPLRVEGDVELSPYNPRPKDSSEQQQLVECVSMKDEASGIRTFTFKMPKSESGEVGKYLPGQFATFDFQDIEGPGTVTNRTWTVSSHPSWSEESKTFTITVKRIGVASGWLHEKLRVGDSIEFRGFGGDFTPAEEPEYTVHKALLIAGGIGITPLRSMVYEFEKRKADVVLLYSVRSQKEAAFLDELSAVSNRSEGRIKIVTTVTGIDPGWDGPKGRIDKAFIQSHVPDVGEREFYMCGPTTFMDAVSDSLEALGCGLENLHQESFAF